MNVRGACPGLSAPMATGDGLLARFSPAQAISLASFVGLCEAARRCGNGTMEITARGNLQVRGLTPRSAPAFADAVGVLGIDAAEGVSITADPLAEHRGALLDTSALAAELRNAIAKAHLTLAPKISVVLDAGTHLHLDALAADVRLRALAMPRGLRLHLSVGGDGTSATPVGLLPPEGAVEIVVRLLGMIASGGDDIRAADILRKEGIAAFRSVVERLIEPAPELPGRAPAEVIGRHPLRDGSVAVGVALAFGHAHADDLIALTQIGAEQDARRVRLAPGRALLLLDIPPANAPGVADAAERHGFITRVRDPRRRIIACPGKPACASGFLAARSLAGQLAPHLRASESLIHISGCAKGCAHRGAAALTVVGTEVGCGIIHDGSTRAAPQRYVDAGRLVVELRRMWRGAEEATHG